jgi:hypothetical protein
MIHEGEQISSQNLDPFSGKAGLLLVDLEVVRLQTRPMTEGTFKSYKNELLNGSSVACTIKIF